MSSAKIHGAEYPLRKIFSNDFNFKVPLYQRPYSWTTEQAGELIEDLLGFLGDDPKDTVDDLSPYFLGSIVLIKEEGRPDAEVVDGQQRLTTLTILLSVLRDTITEPKYSAAMTDYLYEEGNPLEGNPNRYRLTLRERDADFFRAHIQDIGKLPSLMSLNSGQLSDSRRNIKANASLFLDRLALISEEDRVRLAQFVIRNCFLVVVSTPDLDAAYRIFSILNDRGLDLSHSDILKSEIIGRIPAKEQDKYTHLWEDAEEELGRQAFGDLFSHVRMIYRKQKMRGSNLKEFREYVIKPVGDPKLLIDSVLVPYASALAVLKTAGYQSTEGAEQINYLLRWLGRIDNTDWIPPALLFLAKFANNPKEVKRFLSDLERLAAFLMLTRVGINDRIERFAEVLTEIEKSMDLFRADSPLQLTETQSLALLADLNGDVYRLASPKRLYLLLRLDSILSDASATYEHGVISIEHVLPQSPGETSQWCEWFTSDALRNKWVHRLGNLLLLTHSKNSNASNFDFERKKAAYFIKGGISPFPLTTQVLVENEWSPEVVERRQKTNLEFLHGFWRLECDFDQFWEDATGPEPEPDEETVDTEKADFHRAIIPRLENFFGAALTAGPNRTWSLSDGSILVSCQVSKRYNRRHRQFWFGLKRSAKERLEKATNAYCAFGLGSPETVVLIPYQVVAGYLNKMRTSPDEGDRIRHWHIEFREDADRILLLVSGEHDAVDVSSNVLR
jgi:hypothetical protein